MKKLMLALLLAGAFLPIGSFLSPSLAQKTAGVPAAAKQELMKAAKAHGVNINTDKIAYASNQQITIVRAPIQGSDKYKDADFVKGAPVLLMIIKSSEKYIVPNGSYVVKIQYPPDALSGNAIFTDATGTVIGQQALDKPLIPLDLTLFGPEKDPCSIINFPRVVRTIPGPIPGPGGGYGLSFPCRDCACNYYERRKKNPKTFEDRVAAELTDHRWQATADARGHDCETAAEPTCSPDPAPWK